MKIAVVFVRVIGKPAYDDVIRRWLDSYRKFRPVIAHDLVIVNRYYDSPDTLFDNVATKYVRYDGMGWDCGTWQFAGKNVDADLLVCMNSSTYIRGDGWLERLVDCVEHNGSGLYGPLASYEVSPHIRTPCMAFQPSVIRNYPEGVSGREDTWRFECMGYPSGVPQFSTWCRLNGFKTMLVTWDGCYDMQNWRLPPNIFRRGDQSNCLVFDRHCDLYTNSPPEYRAFLEKLADGRK